MVKKLKKNWKLTTLDVDLVTNDVMMKKNISAKKTVSYNPNEIANKINEPVKGYYKSIKVLPALKEFTYKEFKKIADKAPFTQAEWATILHVSERTLQRYAKSNGSFAAINAERALQIDKLLSEALITFGSIPNFYNWLKRHPSSLEETLGFESLTSYDGIQKIFTALGRIQHGILA